MDEKEFYIADLSDEQYEANRLQANVWFAEGKPYTCSHGICESKTAGYGRCDYYGYFEYPLSVTNGVVHPSSEN